MSVYTGAKTVVRTVYGNSRPNCFQVKVGMHQGSALSALLFVIVMEAIFREFSCFTSGIKGSMNKVMKSFICSVEDASIL